MEYRFTESIKQHGLLNVCSRSPRNVNDVRSMKEFSSRSVKDGMRKKQRQRRKETMESREIKREDRSQNGDEGSDGLLTKNGVCQRPLLSLSQLSSACESLQRPMCMGLTETDEQHRKDEHWRASEKLQRTEWQNQGRTTVWNKGNLRFAVNWKQDLSQGI